MFSAARKVYLDHDRTADLTAEIERLNVELTCASEAFHAYASENEKLGVALAQALQRLNKLGETHLVRSINAELTGEGVIVSLPTAK